MDQNIKNVLGVAIAIVVLAFGYSAVSYVDSYEKAIQPSSFRSFSVTGDGKAVSIPDVAEFSFTVITEGGKDVATLQTQNTETANRAINFVKSEGVADKDIRTQYYNVSPRYQTYNCYPKPYSQEDQAVQPCPPASIVGYSITQSVEVKIRDFKKIGDIMGGVVTSGANQVGSLSFAIDDPSKVQSEARAKAIAKAKAKAEDVAKAGGFSVGRLLGIQEGGGYSPYQRYDYAAAGVAELKGAPAPSPSIEPGSQEISVNVTLQYEIR